MSLCSIVENIGEKSQLKHHSRGKWQIKSGTIKYRHNLPPLGVQGWSFVGGTDGLEAMLRSTRMSWLTLQWNHGDCILYGWVCAGWDVFELALFWLLKMAAERYEGTEKENQRLHTERKTQNEILGKWRNAEY